MVRIISLLTGVLLFVSILATPALANPEIEKAYLAEDLQLLRRLVLISSDSADRAGVNEVQKVIADELRAMGFVIQMTDLPGNPTASGSLLVAELQGLSSSYVTFLSHSDTVFKKDGGFSGFDLKNDPALGQIAVGPGVIDAKGGTVVILRTIKRYLATRPGAKPHLGLRVVITPTEELISQGWETIFMDISKRSEVVLGFEPATDDGSIISARKGMLWYDFQVQGRAAHAGRDHDKGLNACREVARKTEELESLTNYAIENTVNVSQVTGGGSKYNVVCAEASGKVEARFSFPAEGEKLHQQISHILSKSTLMSRRDGAQTKCTHQLTAGGPAMPLYPENQPYFQWFQSLLEKLEGRKIGQQRTGGVADLSRMARPGLIGIDGLGPYGGNLHAPGEFLRVSTLTSRSIAAAEFLKQYKASTAANTAPSGR